MHRDQIGLPQALAGRVAAARARSRGVLSASRSPSPPRSRAARNAPRSRSVSPPRVPRPERFATDSGKEPLSELLSLARSRAELRRFRTLREHLGLRAAETAWRRRVDATEGTRVRVADDVRCDLVFLRHFNEEGLVRRLDGLTCIPNALRLAPRADLCPFTGASALWPAWWANGRWAAGCRAERSRRVEDGFVVPYEFTEFDDMPVAERGKHYPRVPEWWPEVPPGMPVLLPAVVSYRGSELVGEGSQLKETLWAVALSDWVARIGATLVHCALRERRLWRLDDEVVRWIRTFLRAIFRDTEVRFYEVDAVLSAHEGLNWDDVGRYRGEERANWVPYSPRTGGVDWDRCGIRPLARSSVIPWGLVEGAASVDLSFWRAVREEQPVLTLESLFALAEGGCRSGEGFEANAAEKMRAELVERFDEELVGVKGDVILIRKELEASRRRREAKNKKQGNSESTSTAGEGREGAKSKKTVERRTTSENSDSQTRAKKRARQVDSTLTAAEKSVLSSSSSSDKVTPAPSLSTTPKSAPKSAPISKPRKAIPAKAVVTDEIAELKNALSQARSKIGTLTVRVVKERQAKEELRTALIAVRGSQKKVEASIASVRASALAEGAEKTEKMRKDALELLQKARKRSLVEADLLRKACVSLNGGEGSSRAVEVIDVDGESAEHRGSVKSAESAGGVKAKAGQTAVQQQTISSGGESGGNLAKSDGDGGGNGGGEWN